MKLERREIKLTDIKAKDDEPGKFSGRASVYGVVDSYGDVVMPGAFTKSLQTDGNQIKVLAQHNPTDVIGLATLIDKSDALWIEPAELVLELPSAKDMYTRVKHKLIDGISIGYEVMPGGAVFNKQGIRELHEVKLWEVSLVTWPANTFARVVDVKADPVAVLARLMIESKRLDAMMEGKAGAVFSKENASHIKSIYASIAKLYAQIDDEDEDTKKTKERDTETLARELSDALGSLSL